ncbi:glutamate mutase L [Clostridium sp. CF011]|uniref:methylaspartate mutase accessory protein GlmL n=1 Tax=unclassified Clostridium TaxID=2614128 RepID=UPI001C0AF9E6|nr:MULTISPECIES: methylaspartate mutase accessory protein GlmL [unclassified Clostridium]MBU3091188.1 glutamate mutase L [Clostridium sp. CF011]MBW9146526.1 glutamate mutase L [Clostridium sp. CM027]UVE39593.1 glutamate mutase L [Clostridium sp. CM027]WAG68499.1 glutamate mutase L [Clostridium sp. CF011]
MDAYLLVDFGSTYTKLTVVDIAKEEIIATAKDITTIEDNIMIGYEKAYAKIEPILKDKNVNLINKLACSSAAGGLKMIAIGLVPDLTAEAAKRAALGAGARVLKVYSYELTLTEIEEIKNSDLDIILLAGGTNGGNKECIIHNAKMLADNGVKLPIVVAGNKVASDEIRQILTDAKMYFSITKNVMPTLSKLNVEPAREEIRKVFMEKIIDAKGLSNAEDLVKGILMPTPAAVLKAATILSEGSDEEKGLGDLIIIDIGGATTDVHSIAEGEPTKSGVSIRGLEEPFAKRTVEGDLGMRYSAVSLREAAGSRKIRKYLGDTERKIDIEANCKYRIEHIKMVPTTKEEIEFDEAMAKVATDISMERHVGTVEHTNTPMGAMYTQTGKDLMEVKYMIGTGGALIHSDNPQEILKAGAFSAENPTYLKPRDAMYLIDKTYILSAMGLLSQDYPDKAVRIMKKYLVKV